jgi:tetratricopeptide (TPR) repeat protein
VPVLVLVEDTHWSDPTTLELLTRLATTVVPQHRIFLLVTHRSSQDLGWQDLPHVETILLGRLDAEDSRKIVTQVVGDGLFALEALHGIIENGDGVPLFIEELTRAADESRLAQGGSGKSPASPPTTLEDSLRERLDRLSVGKRVAQMAAVIGRRFSTSLLQSMVDLDEADFKRAIAELIEANIIERVGDSGDDHMLFRHALIQQAAYASLLRRQRQDYHARIAATLLQRYPGLAETEPETLAWHYSGAGKSADAVQFLTIAGQRATSRAAQVEAINHYNSALEHLMQLPESRERSTQEVLLRALLGGALMAVRGFAAPEVHDSFARARELCLELGDSPMFCACLYGLLTVNASRSNREETLSLAEEMMQAFGDSPVPSWAIAANFTAGFAKFFLAEFDAAQEHFERAIESYSTDQHATLVEQFGDDLAEFSMCYLQWLHLLKGNVDDSARFLDRAETLANELNNKNAQVRSISFRMGRLQELGDVESVARIAPEIIRIATEQGYPYWASAGQIGLGWTQAETGSAEEGVEMIRGCLGFFDLIGQKNPQTFWRTYLVAALINAGQREQALEETDFALKLCDEGLDKFFAGKLMYLKGRAALMQPADVELAESCFREALAISERTGAALHALYAVTGLAELLAADGRGGEVRQTLETAIGAITAAEDFPALSRARSLLTEIG